MLVVGEALARRLHAFNHRLGTDGRGWVVWACFAVLVVLSRLDSTPSIVNVIDVYREAGLRWLRGEDLYPAQFRFNYLPPAAVFFVAWNWLPFAVVGALWRIANIAIFALGFWQLSASGETPQRSSRFFVATLITIALSASTARYGQMTLAMSGLMMMALADLETGRVSRPAILAALAVVMKPLAIVAWLMLIAVFSQLRWRTVAALAFLLLLPFLFQHTDYVLHQYAAVPEMLMERAHGQYEWQHLFALFENLGWNATDPQQTVIRGVSAAGVVYLSWRTKRRPPAIGMALNLYALAACYILLLGAGTESNTYGMLAPVIGLVAATAWQTRDRSRLALMGGVAVVMLLSHTLIRAFPDTVLANVKPIACGIVFAWVAYTTMRAPERQASRAHSGSSDTAASARRS